ncbi:TRIM60 [Acrasis kona]|uniref:TRIM60 n=1 Tax=Acrasis kona TaxID=1008807 RepID=A0AAW2ZE60_9EUKA
MSVSWLDSILFFTDKNKKRRLLKLWLDHLSLDATVTNDCFNEDFQKYLIREKAAVQQIIDNTIDNFGVANIKDVDPNIIVLYENAIQDSSLSNVKETLKKNIQEDPAKKVSSFLELTSFTGSRQHQYDIRNPVLLSVHSTSQGQTILPQKHKALLIGKAKLTTEQYALAELIMSQVIIDISKDFYEKVLFTRIKADQTATADIHDKLKKIFNDKLVNQSMDVQKLRIRKIGREDLDIFEADKQEDPTVTYLTNILTTIMVGFLIYKVFAK